VGLFTSLLLLPVAGPGRGLMFVLEKIKDQVDAEMLDEGRIQDELVALSLRCDLGEIEETDYLAREAVLLERINAIRAYKESMERGDAPAEEEGE